MLAFRVVQGKTKKIYYPVTPSTALVRGSLVELTSGKIAASDDNDTQIDGILDKEIATTDADYALDRLVPVIIPTERHVVYEHVGTASFVATDIGTEYGISSSTVVDHADTTNDVFKVTKVVSASVIQGFLKINGSY